MIYYSKRILVKGKECMKKSFLIRNFRISISSFVIGILIILFSNPLAQFFYTQVERNGTITTTYTDETNAFRLMINFNVIGAIISIAGVNSLILSGYLYYKDLEVRNE